MQNLSIRVCEKLRAARREQGLGQVELSNEIGCKQPALSAFEKGNPTKLSEETVVKLAKRLGVSLEERPAKETVSEEESRSEQTFVSGFCPDPACPSNTAYAVGNRRFWRVTLQNGKFCAHCGEVLEKRCPACGAELNAGACCSLCGHPYVAE